MFRNLVVPMLVVAVFSSDASAAVGDLSRGHIILLERGLQLDASAYPGLNNSFNVARWAESNFTTINFSDRNSFPANVSVPNMPWGRLLENEVDLKPHEFPFADNLVRLQVSDEQDITNQAFIDEARTIFDDFRLRYPNVLMHTNQGGNQFTAAQVRTYMEDAKPDMLMFDTYPFNGNLTGGSPTNLYRDLWKYRVLATDGISGDGSKPIPFGMYTQAFVWAGSNFHLPSESEIQLNSFAAWAFGATVTDAFYYDFRAAGEVPLMFSGAGTDSDLPTSEFFYTAETNRQSLNLGSALVRLDSRDVRMIMGQGGLPGDISQWDGTEDPYMTGIDAFNLGSKNSGNAGDVIVGYYKALDPSFTDAGFENDDYFMIVNGLSDATGTAAETSQKIVLTFDFAADPSINSLLRVSRTDGSIEVVPLTNISGTIYELDLTLEGGTGDLFKFNNGSSFLGATVGGAAFAAFSIPEPATASLLATGLIVVLLRSRRQRK